VASTSPVAACHARATYVPRSTQDCDAVAIVREHWPAFRDRLEMHAGPLPAFVRDELEAFATCGHFERGFLVVQCRRCGDSLRVPFACKSRGICPSCMGRRMCETAALLVDHRLPAVPWRQWVLSFEGSMAVRLGYDKRLLTLVCQRFAKRVMQTLRRQAKLEHGLATQSTLYPGVLIVVQRFRADLGLFVHLHALATEGCFEAVGNDDVRFMPIEQLSQTELVRVLEQLRTDLDEHLDDEGEPPDEAVAACVQLGLPGAPLRPALLEPPPPAPMLASGFGRQRHAAVTVDGRDRKRLERVCRYLLRPAFAHDAVQRTPDGQVRVHFKRPNKAGATYAQMSPDKFLARLCALVPPPGAHTILYYGVLAGRHTLRSRVVPDTHAHGQEPKQLALFLPRNDHELAAITKPLRDEHLRDRPPTRLSWMQLLARVFKIDISVCRRCQGPMRIVRAVTDPDEIAAELHGARAPPRPTPRGQIVLFPT
jgi:hypothetical protein